MTPLSMGDRPFFTEPKNEIIIDKPISYFIWKLKNKPSKCDICPVCGSRMHKFRAVEVCYSCLYVKN